MNVKNIKNIAYIQDLGLLTNEQIIKYMGKGVPPPRMSQV